MAATRLTAQQEKFAQLVALHGLKQSVAYRKAYDCSNSAPDTVWCNASKLMADTKVVTRIEELRKLAASKLEVTVERIAQELARIGFSDPAGLVDDDGNFLPLHLLPEDMRRAVQSIKVVEKAGAMKVSTDNEDEPAIGHIPERTKEIRFWNKTEALGIMAKWQRMLIDRMEIGAPGEFDNKSVEELDAEIMANQRALAAIDKARKRTPAKA